ncbi:carboxylate--amine ligase [Chengkuizengella sp. SCS-71B]|uniref:carboxylate--amine ligase n=1 Tax=Chengkuizengella sp. SCS-71B TaxID=3115290 RepID=UPI0032C22AD4
MTNKAIILGCNYYIGLSTIRCLGVHGIHTVAVDYSEKGAYGAKSKHCSERLIAPHYKKETKKFIRFLINYAREQNSPPVLIPCHDSYVEIIDEHLEELKKCYLIPQTEAGLYSKLMNKETLHQIAQDKGVKVPETVRVNEENFMDKVENIIKYPCLVKPVDSPTFVAKFRKKLFKVHNKEELEASLDRAKNANLEVIVQRIIPGFDDHMYTYDAYLNQDSKVTHWLTCQKYRQYPINFGASVYTGQKYVPELHEIGTKFFEEIGYKGFAEIEFKKDAETGQYYLIEINVRITNINQLLYKVGVNIPHITYQDLTGSPVTPKAIEVDTDVRFWCGYEDMYAIRDYIRTKQLSFKSILKSLLFKPKAYAIWDWKDPIPAFSNAGMITSKIFKRLLHSKK